MWVVKSESDCEELQIDVMLLNDYNKMAHEIQTKMSTKAGDVHDEKQ